MSLEQLYPLGTMTVFYVPSHKLDDPSFYGQITARNAIHRFLVEHYQAYTHTPSPVKGYWVNERGSLVHDVTERFEVSFNTEADFALIIDFLYELCQRLQEKSIYVTRGDKSYLLSNDS